MPVEMTILENQYDEQSLSDSDIDMDMEEEHDYTEFPKKLVHSGVDLINDWEQHNLASEGEFYLDALEELPEQEEAEEEQDKERVIMHDLHSPIASNFPNFSQKNYVSVFEGLALSTILEEVYLQLEILGHSFPGQIVTPEESDFLTYDERFSSEVEDKDLDYMPRLKNFKNPFVIDETQIGTPEERMAKKLQKDRAFLQELLRLARKEIDESRTFESLKDNVTREDGRRHEEITLMEREKNAVMAVTKMRQKIVDFKAQMKRDEHKRLEMINHLKDQLHEAKQQGKQDARYTRAWYEARNAHNFAELSHRTEIAQLRNKALEVDMTRDKLAHSNIQSWYDLIFEETQQRLDKWKTKFEDDMEIIDKKIRDQNDVIRAQQSLMESLNNTIAERMVELGPWEEEKDAERHNKADYFRLYYNARKIQRWWRSYMTRHNLYKKKKGKKGKKD
ncbi:unnamed protein product [Allacma fusca]|uniref:Dynein regulatory complex protein 9 n=1 Tax=Allacma fusca TaxID=39272 RepID=A0A8J2LS29_9HEXA|nr:unnamed protein product [Allacma fusca]